MNFPKNEYALSEKTRKALCLGEAVPPRKKLPNEATGVQICAATAPVGYVPGDGEVAQPVRAGAGQVRVI